MRICPRSVGDLGPCVHVACRRHLWGDVVTSDIHLGAVLVPAGSIRTYHPGIGPEDLEETCALDVALRGALPGEAGVVAIAAMLGLNKRYARDVIRDALGRFLSALAADEMERLKAEIDVWHEWMVMPGRHWTSLDAGDDLELCCCESEGEVVRCHPQRLLEGLGGLPNASGQAAAWAAVECAEKRR